MSGEGTPVLAGTIPALELLMSRWERMALNSPEYAPWIEKGLECALKYYRHVDDTRAYVIALCKS
jgi:hypothetical protein